MTAYRLTNEAQTKHDRLTALLADLGLTPNQALALLLAPDMAEHLAEKQDDTTPEDVVDAWCEDGHQAWADVLCEAPAFLTNKA